MKTASYEELVAALRAAEGNGKTDDPEVWGQISDVLSRAAPTTGHEAPSMELGPFPTLSKEATGQIQSRTYKYVTLDHIMAKIRPELRGRGVHIIHFIDTGGQSLRTQIRRDADLEILAETDCPLIGATDMQKLGSAITYARRYSICMLLSLVADEDDDGAAAMVPEEPEQTALEELSLLAGVADLSPDRYAKLRRELVAFCVQLDVSPAVIASQIADAGYKDLSEMTSGGVAAMLNDIEDSAKADQAAQS